MQKPPAGPKHGTRALAALVLVSFGLSPLSPALAAAPAGKRRVLVVKTQRAPDVPTIVLSRVAGYVETILGMNDKVELVTSAGLAPEVVVAPAGDKLDTSVERGSIDRADEAATQAHGLTQRKRWADAVKAWTKALTLYDKAIAWLDDPGRYAAALAGRAYAYFGSGYDDNGEGDLGRAFAIDPELVVDEKLAPRNAVAVAARVRARVKPAGLQVKVTANAPRAVVFINGKNRGAAPVTVGDLPLGDHIVRVVAEGHDPFGQVVNLLDTSVDVAANLTARPGAAPAVELGAPREASSGLEVYAASGDYGAAFQAQAAKIARANGLDAIVMSYVRKNQGDYDLGVFVWENGRVAEVPTARVAGDLSALQVTVLESIETATTYFGALPAERSVVARPAIYEAIVVARAEPPKVEPAKTEPPKVEPAKAEPPKTDLARKPVDLHNYEVQPLKPKSALPEKPPEKDDETAFYETWWFWTLVGGIAAGSAAAIALSVGGSEGPGGFSTTVTW